MNQETLGQILRDMYNNAKKGEQVAHIHLFGIKYGSVIIENRYSMKEIIDFSGIHTSYQTELSKGVKLSKYVKLKN
jgi:hypothetical protein